MFGYDTPIEPTTTEDQKDQKDQKDSYDPPEVFVVTWQPDLYSQEYFVAAFKDFRVRQKCSAKAESIGYDVKSYRFPVTTKCDMVCAYPHRCEYAKEIPSSVHIVLVIKNIQYLYRVFVFETLDSANGYANVANHFGFSTAIFANVPVRDSFEGLDCSYEKVKVSKNRDSPIEESASPKKVSSMESIVGQRRFFGLISLLECSM